jgi:hypothetical protein
MATLADNHVSTLLGLGADAMSNMFDVIVTPPEGIAGWVSGGGGGVDPNFKIDELKFRIKTFKVPMLNIDQYAVQYKTVEVNRPKSKITGDRSFDLTFRLDSYYSIYTAFKEWEAYVANTVTGYAASSVPATGTVKVYANYGPLSANAGYLTGNNTGTFEDAGGANSMKWEFDNVWCWKVTEPEFAMEDSSPLEVTASFYFGNMTNPWSVQSGFN